MMWKQEPLFVPLWNMKDLYTSVSDVLQYP